MWPVTLLPVTLLLPLLAVHADTAVRAAPEPPFEIDGNTSVDVPGGVDWDVAGAHRIDPTGKDDLSAFAVGSEEFEHPQHWEVGRGEDPPGAEDITDVYSFSTVSQDRDAWLSFGFRRATAEGVTGYDVELRQYEPLPSRPTELLRQSGDVLMRFLQDGAGALVLADALSWTWSSNERWNDGCHEVSYEPSPVRGGWCPVSGEGSGIAGAVGEDGLFAEGTLNLSALFDDAPSCRGALSTMYVRSFTGDLETSALEDFVEPVDIDVPALCWSPIYVGVDAQATYDVAFDWSVHQVVDSRIRTVATGAPASFNYRILLTAGPEQRSGNELRGNLVLTNPNTEPVVATIEASATSATDCTFQDAVDASPDPGLQVVARRVGTTVHAYRCTVTLPARGGNVNVTATWNPAVYPQGPDGPGHTGSAAAAYGFTLDQSTDEYSTVASTLDGASTRNLGTFSWPTVFGHEDPTTPPETLEVARYGRTFTAGPAGACSIHGDTARQTETDSGRTTSSIATVTVCATAPPEPLPSSTTTMPAPSPGASPGTLGGRLRASCTGVVRVVMRNTLDEPVRFTLHIGRRVSHFRLHVDQTRRWRTTAPARTRVVLRARGETIDRLRVPGPCRPAG